MDTTRSAGAVSLSDDWCANHYDPMAPELAGQLYETLDRMRSQCPVAHSDQHGGFWVATGYEDVVRVTQDWKTFTVEEGLTVPVIPHEPLMLPEEVDPPIHRAYRQVINPYFSPARVAKWEEPTRQIATRLIDAFIETGTCDFMADFATPYPGLAFFDLVLGAPREDIDALNEWARALTVPSNPDGPAAWAAMMSWMRAFVARRQSEPPRGDFVDAVLAAEIDGRPITEDEILGTIYLLTQGGLETTSGALGQFVIRFCKEPEIPALIRRNPELIPAAVEELLRLDTPFVMIGRTARHDTELAGRPINKGDKVLVSWASANMDDREFRCPAQFDASRRTNRHVTFGVGPHRCVGSHLARMNLRIAAKEIVTRLDDLNLHAGADLPFHSVWNRTPLTVPITFTPGPRIDDPTSLS